MLDTLHIRNYKNLREFKLEALEQINLFAGKNNTGKSSVLEAISLYACKGNISQIHEILTQRGEGFCKNAKENDPSVTIEKNTKSASSIFYNREVNFDAGSAIVIGRTDSEALPGGNLKDAVVIRFVKYVDEFTKDDIDGLIHRRRVVSDSGEFAENESSNIGVEIKLANQKTLIPLDRDIPSRFAFRGVPDVAFQFIRTANIDKQDNGKLFDHVALTEKEKYIVDALRVIEPQVERIAFIEEENAERVAVVKLSGNPHVLPLKSLGDGINRIFAVSLALVSAADGYLLIDEFENGLHHSVQEQFWRVIFRLSKALNVQVFATTHSRDTVCGFEKILNDDDNTLYGKLFRLENTDGEIVPVEYSSEKLKAAQEEGLETR